MDSRLILTTLFVTLSWAVLGTYAQNNTTMAPNMTTLAPNMTTLAPNMTTVATTTVPPLVTNTTTETLATSISRVGCATTKLCVALPDVCDPSTLPSCFFFSFKQRTGQDFDMELSGEAAGYIAISLSTGPDDAITYICADNNGKVEFITALYRNGQLTLSPLDVNSVKGRVVGRLIQCTFLARLPDSSSRSTKAATFAATVLSGSYDPSTASLGAPQAILETSEINLSDVSATVTVTPGRNFTTNTTTTMTPTNTTATPTKTTATPTTTTIALTNTTITPANTAATQTNTTTASNTMPPTTGYAVNIHQSVMQCLLVFIVALAVL